MTMTAFHNNPAIKRKYLRRVAAHRRADQMIQGTGWDAEQRKGCAVGCTLEAYDHARYQTELGIPEVLARLEDQLFELQSPKDAQRWPERFLRAIPVGADLSHVWPQWAHWMLVDPTHGVIRHAGDHADVRAAIQGVADLYAAGRMPAAWAAWAAASAAWAAWAAWAAASAAWAAWAAASVAWAAASAAWAASAAASAADAAEAWTTAACDELIRLLEAV